MRSLSLTLAFLAASLVPAFGQIEVNKPGASLDIDGVVSDGTFLATTTTITGGSAVATFSSNLVGQTWDLAFNNFALTTASAVPLAGQTVNLDINQGFTFLSGGPGYPVIGSPLGGTSYTASLTITAPGTPGDLSLQAYATDPSNPGGLAISQGSQLAITNTITTPLTLGDDDAQPVAVGTSFPFYGNTYTDVYVGSNGFVTFGSGDNDFSESTMEFLNNQPRIAALWDDLNPTSGGTVSVTADGSTGITSIDYAMIPEFSATGANTFSIQLDPAGMINIVWNGVSSVDSLVGLSPGGGLGTGLPLDLSATIGTGTVLNPTDAPYEIFTSGFDLDTLTLTFIVDPSGNPLAIL